MTLPNLITIARILSVPFVIYLLVVGEYLASGLVFVFAGISDAVDGFLAKRFGLSSELGGYLDPLADKLLLVSTILTLGYRGDLPIWFILLATSRDVMIVGGVLLSWLVGNPVPMRPLNVSKATTFSQILLVGVILFSGAGLGFLGPAVTPILAVSAALTLASAIAYGLEWIEHMGGYEVPHFPSRPERKARKGDDRGTVGRKTER